LFLSGCLQTCLHFTGLEGLPPEEAAL
jgi:hypothetical protein